MAEGVAEDTSGFSNIVFDDSGTADSNGDQPTSSESNNNTANGTNSNSDDGKHLTKSEKLLLASTLVNDAVCNRNLDFKTGEKYVRAYRLFNHKAFRIVLYICIWGNLSLAVFEKPAVEAVAIPYWGTMIMELCFLGYFFFRYLHNAYFSELVRFLRDPKNLVILITIILTILDMICYSIWVNTSSGEYAVRWSRPLRVLFLINFPENRQLRKAFRNIRRTLPDIIHVLVLLLSSIAIFALLVLKLMERRGLTYPSGDAYFVNYWDSFWDLYVLVTTANNPDAMMPAYDASNWFALFFIVYTIINLYIFMNIVLAVIYSNYKRHLKNEVKASVYLKRRLLSRSFELLKEKVDGMYVVTKETWTSLMKSLKPKMSSIHINLLLYVLDESGQHSIDKTEFMKVADILNLELKEVKMTATWFENKFPRFYLSRPSEVFRQVVLTRYFTWFFDLLIFINAICIALSLEEAEYFFLPAFTLEVCFKLYALGIVKFFQSFWNRFDFVVITAALLVTIIESAIGDSENRSIALDVLLVLRVLRLIRLLGAIDRFYVVLTTVVNIGPSIATYGAVIFVFYYIYAIIGMETFKGLITYYGYDETSPDQMWCGNEKLEDSEFYTKHYCSNNFNNVFHSLVVLFELMVVNQWHIITNGFVLVTSKAARLYFISFHLICVVILLNIFTAFVLEIFILEYTLSKGKLETAVESKIKEMGLGRGQTAVGRIKHDKKQLVENMEGEENRTTVEVSETPNGSADVMPWEQEGGGTLRFKLSSGAKDVETLLQLMFEGEINPADEGLDQTEDDQIKYSFDTFTL